MSGGTSIKLACINIERSRHLDRVTAFLAAYRPDVLCLQELSEPDIPLFEQLMGQPLAFAPMTLHDVDPPPAVVGLGLVAPTPLQAVANHTYKGDPARLPTYIHSGKGAKELPNTTTINHALLCATVEGFRIATTHLTWTAQGESTPEQLHDADELLKFAEAEAAQHGGLVMCGDFNAPRGRATFGKIAARFADTIPAHYQTSLDLELHRVGRAKSPEAERLKGLMVDGLFVTPNYRATDVRLNAGVSDHMAITATLTRV